MRVWHWLMVPTRRPYFVIVAAMVLVGTALYVAVQNQKDVERRQRDQAITLAIQVQHRADARATRITYQSALASCRRGKALRSAVRTDAFAIRRGARAEHRFFDTAIRRATAQTKDPAVSAATRAAAKAALDVYGDLQAALPVNLTIPPKPPNCLEVITDPNAPVAPHHS